MLKSAKYANLRDFIDQRQRNSIIRDKRLI